MQSTLIYKARQSIFSTVRFINDGKHLLTGNASRTLTLWDVNTGIALQKWKVSARKHTRPKTAVIFSAALWSKNKIATESSAGLLEVWPIKSEIAIEQ